jgi:hypothetical protein
VCQEMCRLITLSTSLHTHTHINHLCTIPSTVETYYKAANANTTYFLLLCSLPIFRHLLYSVITCFSFIYIHSVFAALGDRPVCLVVKPAELHIQFFPTLSSLPPLWSKCSPNTSFSNTINQCYFLWSFFPTMNCLSKSL